MLVNIFLYFTVYSFLGWSLETAYASIRQRKFINRGFLIGPFTPIYGFGAILIIASSKLIFNLIGNYNSSLLISLIFSTLMVTSLEFITGYVLEKAFNSKWWDYSDLPFNIKGYICLKYSILWGILAFLLVKVVHPNIEDYIIKIPISIKLHVSIVVFLYILFDTYKSVISTLDLRKAIINYSDMSLVKYKEKVLKYKRIFLAFPRLLNLNEGIKNRDVRSIVNGRIEKIKVKIKNRFQT